jgi:putative FmdB family regulatory protein
MPLFEYVCDDCGTEFEALVRRPESESAECPSCGGAKLTTQLSSFQSPTQGKHKPAATHSKEHDVYSSHDHDD